MIETKSGNADVIDAISQDVKAWTDDSLLPRSLMGGRKAMIAEGQRFLPQDYLEKDDNYAVRLSRSFLVNAFGKTVSFLGGQVFQKGVVFADSFPPDFIEYNKDIDLKGSSLDTFAKQNFETGNGEGVVHVLVDTNNKDGEYTSKAEEKADGIRPYFREIKGTEILGGIVEGGKLVQLRIAETKDVREGKYGITTVDCIRVLEPGKWELHKKVDSGWKLDEKGTTSLDYIPIVSYIPGERTSILTGRSPLRDLAELNLDHWQSKSDQNNILHQARVPKLFGKMLDLKVMENSPHNMVISMDENGDLKWVEISGKAIEAGQKDLTETEAKMAMWGLQQLIPRTGNQTATEKALSSSESNSSLGSWAEIYQSFLIACFEIMADYEKTSLPEDPLSVNQEYAIGLLDPEMVKAYQVLVDSRILSAAAAFSELKRKGFINDEMDWLEVSAEIVKEDQESSIMPNNFGTE